MANYLKVPQPVKMGSTFAEDWENFKDAFEILLMATKQSTEDDKTKAGLAQMYLGTEARK